ncbi:MAG TPA: hypothetical protein VK154_14000 [Chitinophagales bacterium]|nr:hypothetical protein [Chitinophagales bacterium]
MKSHILSLLAVMLLHAAFAQSLKFEYGPHTGGFGVMPTVYFNGNYYITRNNSGKKLCSKFDAAFRKVAEVERDLKKMAPAKAPLLVRKDIATRNNLYTTFTEFNNWDRSVVFYKLNPDLSLTDRRALLTHTSKDMKDYARDGIGSGLDAVLVSEDRTKVAYICPSDYEGKEITVVLADENLNILWQKEYAYPQPAGEKKMRLYDWFNLYKCSITNDGKTLVALLPDSVGIKGLLFTQQGIKPFEYKNNNGKAFHNLLSMQGNTAVLLSLYGNKDITQHRLKGMSSAELDLTTGQITGNKNLVFDAALFAGFKPDNDKKITDVSYFMEVLPQADDEGHYIKISRVEYHEKTSATYVSPGNSLYSTYEYPTYTNKLILGTNKALDKVKFSHTLECNFKGGAGDTKYTGGAYLLKNHLVSIDRSSVDASKKFIITLISPDGAVKEYSSDHKAMPAWLWEVNEVTNPDSASVVLRGDAGTSDYGFIKISLQ